MKDLEKLSRERKLQLLDAAREKKKRLKKLKPRFKPHDSQLEVINATNQVDNIYLFCGNGWGKTACGTNIVLWWVKGYNPIIDKYYKVPETVIVLLDHPSKVQEVWLPEIKKWEVIKEEQLKKNGKPYVNEILFENGSRIIFMFHEQPPMIWESVQISKLVADEPPPRHIIVALRRGMREKGKEPKFVMLGTPLSQPYLRKEIYLPWKAGTLKNTEIFFGSTEDNKENLREGYIEEFSQYLTEDEKKTRLEGSFFNASALPLTGIYDERYHLITQDYFDNVFDKRSDPCVIAIDPAQSKPNVACLLGCDRNGNLYYIDEISRKELPRQFAKHLKKWQHEYKVVDIVWDSAGEAEGTAGEGYLTFANVMIEEGIKGRPTTKQDKNDNRFIERIQEALYIPENPDRFGQRIPKLRILIGNVGITSDITNVQWQVDKLTKEAKPKLDIRDTDHLACLKYALACNLTPLKGRERVVRRAARTSAYGFNKKRKFKHGRMIKR